jgi:hypothetical protein
MIFCSILHAIDPSVCPNPEVDASPDALAHHALQHANKIGITVLIEPQDLLVGNPRVNFLFSIQLFRLALSVHHKVDEKSMKMLCNYINMKFHHDIMVENYLPLKYIPTMKAMSGPKNSSDLNMDTDRKNPNAQVIHEQFIWSKFYDGVLFLRLIEDINADIDTTSFNYPNHDLVNLDPNASFNKNFNSNSSVYNFNSLNSKQIKANIVLIFQLAESVGVNVDHIHPTDIIRRKYVMKRIYSLELKCYRQYDIFEWLRHHFFLSFV